MMTAALLLLGMAGQATSPGWTLQSAPGSGPVLEYRISESNLYRFTCDARTITALQTGVTGLLDLRSGNQIADDAAAVMPDGAAMMAVYGGKGDPAFVPATAVKHPGGGWDLTIRRPINDPQVRAMTKAKMMSLFTTGHTTAVAMDSGDQAKWRQFLETCAALPG